ncbi:hypothetical protein FQN57_003639, partial [Myotisia sp. PD_48]
GLLKKDISNARIFTFGYDADVASFWGGASQNRLANHASSLIGDLENRSLIFVVHSLGGLVTERALQISETHAEQHLRQIESSTIGILFLGTPHSGSGFAPFAKTVAQTLRAIGKRVNTNILDTLKRESQTLLDVEDWFAQWLRRRVETQKPISITCFYEEYELPIVGSKVVPEESAGISGYALYAIGANHMNMPKFAGEQDVGYKRVLAELQRWIKELEKHSDHINENELNILYRLPIAEEAAFNSKSKEHESLCLNNTRATVLDEIDTWANENNKQCIFWLCGMAGTGKSTIARTIANRYTQQNMLGASFFFSRGGKDVNNAEKFFTTIARQLAVGFPTIRRHICDTIEKFQVVTKRDQWKKLVIEPLAKYTTSGPRNLVIVIDALDECDRDDDIRLILQLLTEDSDFKLIRLRILITSRPETPIRLGFKKMDTILHRDLVLDNISRRDVDHDILAYFQARFAIIQEVSEYLPRDWPGDNIIDELVQKAGGLFIYAATICRFIEAHMNHWPPQGLLGVFIPNDGPNKAQYKIPSNSPTAELDMVYIRILEHYIAGATNKKDKEVLAEELGEIVGSIVLLSEPLSPMALDKLLGLGNGTTFHKLRHFYSILKVTDTIRLLHPSFRDFLLNKSRCSNMDFWVDEGRIHANLATKCIQLMGSSLKRNVCGINNLGTFTVDIDIIQVEQHLPSEIHYACVHWVDHFKKSGGLVCNTVVYNFLKKHFLHWIEALALLGRNTEGVLAVTALESLMKHSDEIYPFVYDAKRFILFSQPIIHKAPLQLYCSALLFAPETSVIKNQFKGQIPLWFDHLPPMDTHWNAIEQTLEGHSRSVTSVAFSPD